MKRFLTCLTACALLISSLAVCASAFADPPSGKDVTPAVPELTVKTTPPEMNKLLTVGLTTSPYCSVKGVLDVDWKTAPAITAENQKDIADHLKYGFSVAGVSKLQRMVYGAIDGYWNTGNAGSANSAGASKYGAFAYYMNEYLYNKDGLATLNPEADGAQYDKAPEGYIYQLLLTFNFGVISKLESFGWYLGPNMKSWPQAADIYVSDNGTDWKLVGYYDRVARLMQTPKNDYSTSLTVSMLGADATGNADTDTNNKIILFNLPENTKGQFLRIACTAGNSVNDNYGTGSEYGSGLRAWNDTSSSGAQTWREMFVFGEKTQDVGYEYSTEQESSSEAQTETGSGETPTAEQETIKVREKSTTKATEAATQSQATEAVTDPVDAPKSGCGSTVASLGIIGLMTVGGVLLVRKKRK